MESAWHRATATGLGLDIIKFAIIVISNKADARTVSGLKVLIDVITHFSNFETRDLAGILKVKFPYKSQQEPGRLVGLQCVYDVWCQLARSIQGL